MIERLVRDAANKAVEIAKSRGGATAIEHGLALACKSQPPSFKNKVRWELRKRGYRT